MVIDCDVSVSAQRRDRLLLPAAPAEIDRGLDAIVIPQPRNPNQRIWQLILDSNPLTENQESTQWLQIE